jgi:hypothetical protein
VAPQHFATGSLVLALLPRPVAPGHPAHLMCSVIVMTGVTA